MKVQTILATKSTKVITSQPEQTLKEAALLLTEHNIGSLVVLNNTGELVGIVTERDIIRAAARHDDVLSQTISQVMTKKVITGLPQDDVMSVAHTMTENRFRHLPILDQGDLVGIISIGDVVKFQRDHYRGERDTLQTQIIADES